MHLDGWNQTEFRSRVQEQKRIKYAGNSNMLHKEGDLPSGMALGAHDIHVMSPAL